MKCTADEATMNQRRLERLDRVTFFVKSKNVPDNARRFLSLGATHNLLTGYFQNSCWRTAAYCVKQAIRNSWRETSITARLFWYRRVLRLSDSQIDRRFSS